MARAVTRLILVRHGETTGGSHVRGEGWTREEIAARDPEERLNAVDHPRSTDTRA